MATHLKSFYWNILFFNISMFIYMPIWFLTFSFHNLLIKIFVLAYNSWGVETIYYLVQGLPNQYWGDWSATGSRKLICNWILKNIIICYLFYVVLFILLAIGHDPTGFMLCFVNSLLCFFDDIGFTFLLSIAPLFLTFFSLVTFLKLHVHEL